MNTMIAYQDILYFVRGKNTALSKGGSGDVLTGMIAGIYGQSKNPLHAALTGCLIHLNTADNCRKKYGEYATLPSDLIEECKSLFISIMS